jgi:hypothetical protein
MFRDRDDRVAGDWAREQDQATHLLAAPGGTPAALEVQVARMARYASAFWSARHIAGFCDDATLKRIQVEGSWLGQKRLPGAAR